MTPERHGKLIVVYLSRPRPDGLSTLWVVTGTTRADAAPVWATPPRPLVLGSLEPLTASAPTMTVMDGGHLYLAYQVGSSIHLIKSEDLGSTWTSISSSPLPMPTTCTPSLTWLGPGTHKVAGVALGQRLTPSVLIGPDQGGNWTRPGQPPTTVGTVYSPIAVSNENRLFSLLLDRLRRSHLLERAAAVGRH